MQAAKRHNKSARANEDYGPVNHGTGIAQNALTPGK
jgi:hypothetical protein